MLRANHMPNGRPIKMQKNRAVSTSASVTIACDQAPIAPMATNDSSVAAPMPRLDICQAISENSKMATGAGIPSKNCWKPLRMKSTGTRMPWNSGRKCSTSQSMA
ncbi:hypothetical protein D3C79_820440 [compost metagenome]